MRTSNLVAVCKSALFAALFATVVFSASAQAYGNMMQKDSSGSGQNGSSSAAPPPAGTMQSSGQAAMTAQTQLTGSLASIDGNTAFLTLSDGSAQSVAIGPSTLVLERMPATLDSIMSGDALGVAATKNDDGSLTATAINVFAPQLWEIVRKGQFPMANGQVMTNEQVDRIGGGVQGHTLYLKYEMLTAAIDVPDSATVHRSVVASLGDLAPGMQVMVRGSVGSDGMFDASLLSFDKP